MNENLIRTYIPMSETAFYILLALQRSTHGYGIIQTIQSITNGRLKLGAGTIYGTLSKFEADGLIQSCGEEERRKLYQTTALGQKILEAETQRIHELLENINRFNE